MNDSTEEIFPPLQEQDKVLYFNKADGPETYTGELLELDIPHPVYDLDRGVWMRIEREDPQSSRIHEIVQRSWILKVFCPKCQSFLVGIRGTLTTIQSGTQTRLFRHCTTCNYFKEAR